METPAGPSGGRFSCAGLMAETVHDRADRGRILHIRMHDQPDLPRQRRFVRIGGDKPVLAFRDERAAKKKKSVIEDMAHAAE